MNLKKVRQTEHYEPKNSPGIVVSSAITHS